MLAMTAHTECRCTSSLVPKPGMEKMVGASVPVKTTLSPKKERQYPMKRSPGEPQSRSGGFGEKSLAFAGNRTPVGPSTVTTPTELLQHL
jgi:hypothetical protein